MPKIKKIRDVESNIKKIGEENKRDKSDLEEDIEQSEVENFSDFLASEGEITPVLDSEQPQTWEEINVIEKRQETTLPRDQESRPTYIQHREESADVKYLQQTSSASVSPNLRQENIPMSQPAFRQQTHSESKLLQKDIRDDYSTKIESSRGGKKKRYAWE